MDTEDPQAIRDVYANPLASPVVSGICSSEMKTITPTTVLQGFILILPD